MPSRPRTLAVLLLALAGLAPLGAPRAACAQPAPTTDPKEMARRLGEQALAAHGEGRFADAYDGFERAEKVAHSPVLVLWMARSKRGLGQLLAARALYQRVVAEVLPEDASPKWRTAQAEAKSELEALARRIPRLTVTLAGEVAGAAVTIDGAAQAIGAPGELDAGAHEVVLRVPGQPDQTTRVELAEGDPPRTLALGGHGAPATFGARGSIVPGAVLLGVGGAALAAGAITGAFALVLAGEVEDGCDGSACLRADEAKAGDADRLGRASTGLLIGGGALAVSGLVLAIVRPGGASGDAAAAFVVGPGRVGVVGRF